MTVIATRWTDPNTKRYIEAGQISPKNVILSYAVRDSYGRCLSKQGQWELEPMPSNRTDEFMRNCRFDTLAQATDALERVQKVEQE